MRVRGTDRDAFTSDTGFGLEPRRDFVDHVDADTTVIDRDQNRRTLLVTANGQRLGPKLLLDTFRLCFSHRVTGKPNRIFGCDVDPRDAGPESVVRRRRQCGRHSKEQYSKDSLIWGQHSAIVGEQ